MDHVAHLLESTFSPDANTRTLAESSLKQVQLSPGFISTLLQLIMSQSTSTGIKQSGTNQLRDQSNPLAAIYLKNMVTKNWDTTIRDDKVNTINDQEREFLKGNIVQCILSAPENSRLQLLTCLKAMLRHDFPDNWPNFLESLNQMLMTDDPNLLFSGLQILKELVGCYRWKGTDLRGPLYPVISSSFQIILQKANTILHSNDVLAGSICHYVCKIYHNSIEYELSDTQQANDSLITWGNLFLGIIEKQIDIEAMPQDNELRQQYPWWKSKKWAYYCIHKLFSKYANPTFYGAKSKYANFGQVFLQHFVPMILDKYLKQVELFVGGNWFSESTKQQLCLFFAECVVYKKTWDMMKPYVESLLQHFIYPQLCFSKDDAELWKSDPEEYIQSRLDPMRDYKSSSSAAKELLGALVKSRKKQTLVPILTFINRTLQSNAGQSFEEACRFDGGLSLIISIADQVMLPKSPIYKELEAFITTFILPQFKSPHAHLRLKACDAMIYFSELETLTQPTLLLAASNIIQALQDPSLQVKVYAALALKPLLNHDSVKELLKTSVGQIMQILLGLANEIDMDTITDVMESFVDHFSDELVPFAVQLSSQLRETYFRILDEANLETDQDYDEISDKMMAASGILKTIGTLVLAVDSAPEVLNELETVILPLCVYTLQKNLVDLFSEVFDILDICTFSSKTISDEMWKVLPFIYQTFKTDAIDFLDEMLPALDNFVAFGSDVIKQNTDYQKMLLDISFTVFGRADDAGEQDLVRACQLFESILLNLRGSIDSYIPNIITVVYPFTLPKAALTASFKVHSLEVIINCILYNPLMTLQVLESMNAAHAFFITWLGNLSEFVRVHDIKLSVCALSALLEIPALEVYFCQFTVGILELMQEYPEALVERMRMTKMMNGEGTDDGNEDIDYDFGEDDEDLGDEGGIEIEENIPESAETMNALRNKIAENGYDLDENDDESDDYDYTSGLEEDPYFATILDAIDIQARIKSVLSGMTPSLQQIILKGLSADQQLALHQLTI